MIHARTAAALLGVVGLGLGTPAVGAAADSGQVAFDAGRYADAARIWTPLASQGDAQAAFGLGLMADVGTGQPADAAQAYRWYWRAAEGGLAAAEFNCATMLDQGRGTARDRRQAAVFYARAAGDGEPRAAYALGILYADGDGVPRSTAMSLVWFRSAAAAGLPAAVARVRGLARLSDPAARALPASLDYPAGTVAARSADRFPLVWTPQAGGASHYFIEVVSLDGGAMHPVLTADSVASAISARLPADPRAYAWRVYTVAAAGRHYAASPWTTFAVTGAATGAATGAVTGAATGAVTGAATGAATGNSTTGG